MRRREMNYVGGRGGEAGGGSYTCRKLQRAYRHSPSDVVQCRVRTVILLRKRGKGGEDSEEKGSNGRGGGGTDEAIYRGHCSTPNLDNE